MPWATLGDLTLEVGNAPNRFKYAEKTQFAKQERIEGKANLQYVGQELQTLDLQFSFSRSWTDPDEQFKRLQEARVAAKPMPLVLGDGRFSGNYLIQSLEATLRQTDDEGATESLSIRARLTESVDLPEPELLTSQAEPFEVTA